jgi:hypothetical protein
MTRGSWSSPKGPRSHLLLSPLLTISGGAQRANDSNRDSNGTEILCNRAQHLQLKSPK